MSGACFFFMALAQSLLPWGSLRASQLLLQAPPPNLGTPSPLRMADLVATQPRKFCLWLGSSY